MSSKELKQFAAVVRPFVKNSKKIVREVRRVSKKQGKAPDWPWNRFVHAFASNGGAWYWDENVRLKLSQQYSWRVISALPAARRKARLFEATNPLRRKRLAPKFEEVFLIIKQSGGPAAIKRKYNTLGTAKERLEFWKEFPGIGNKYAREIPMRSYDPFFIDKHFAVDARLRAILKIIFKDKLGYAAAEAFFISAAKKLKISCWELDTVLFEKSNKIKAKLMKQMH